MKSRGAVALMYATWGWHVLPVLPNSKVPATQHGVKDATTDLEQIGKWWTQNPEFNIGIATGARSGIVVFDVDPRNGGDVSWAAWKDANGQPPSGHSMQLTAGGGEHHVARYQPDLRSCKLADGLDLLSDGRYFVAYPSSIEDRDYEWEATSSPLDGATPFDIPDAWMESYRLRRKQPDVSATTRLIQGNRNSGLTALGGAMRRNGMTEAEILAALSIANETRCEIPLPSSEIAQIAKSVSRYEPEMDVAADAGVGSEAAEALLDAARAQTREYHFTRATSYLSQPSPLKWIIKGWFPDASSTMIYGESGCGKTFITIDMACHVAAGMPWHGHKIKPGNVIYMAGEGNYGLRQRIASWCKTHNVQTLDNLLISNQAIDVDGPNVAAQVLNAINGVLGQGATAAAIFVDTVNNHMAGDENKPADANKLIDGCNVVARALGAGVCLVHHTGHAIEAKQRARGTSAWKASMDATVLVTKTGDSIEISCTKMKDAEPPKPFFGRLDRVDLGWVDEDGEEVRGAVFAFEENPPERKPKKSPLVEEHRSLFEKKWWASGAKIHHPQNIPGNPF